VYGANQRPVATDVHGLARTCYLLLPGDCVTGSKRKGKANSAPTFRSIEGSQPLYCLSHRSSTKMNEASQRVTYFTKVDPATLMPPARNMTRVCSGIGSRTSTRTLLLEASMHRPVKHRICPHSSSHASRTGFSAGTLQARVSSSTVLDFIVRAGVTPRVGFGKELGIIGEDSMTFRQP
jgi:hypothetical protein